MRRKNENEITYGYVCDNMPGIKYFENILTWNIDGSVGKAFFRRGRFTLSEKVIPLILKNRWKGKIDYLYVKYILEKKAVEKGFAFVNKAGKTRIRNIEIEIPAVEKNEVLIPYILEQKRLAKEYERAYKIKSNILNEIQKIYSTSVEI